MTTQWREKPFNFVRQTFLLAQDWWKMATTNVLGVSRHHLDLTCSRLVRDYLMGERSGMFDLMAWNADSSRMPFKMHSEYHINSFSESSFRKALMYSKK